MRFVFSYKSAPYKNTTSLVSLLTICFILCFSHSGYSQTLAINNQFDALEMLDKLESDSSMSPIKKLEELKQLEQLSEKAGWDKAYLQSIIAIINQYIINENLAGAETLWPTAYKIAQEQGTQEDIIQLEIASVYFTYPFEGVESVKAKHQILLEAASAIESPELLGDIYQALGTSEHSDYSSYDALRYLEEAFRYYGDAKDEINAASVLNSMASIYVSVGNTDTALSYFIDALEIVKKYNDDYSASVINFNMAQAYFSEGKFGLAEKSLFESQRICKKLGDDIGIAWVDASLADIYLSQEQWSDAVQYYKSALPIFVTSGDTEMQFYSLSGIVRAYTGWGKLDSAFEARSELEKLLPSVNVSDAKQTFFDFSARLFYQAGNYQSAYLSLFDSIEEQKRRDELNQLEQTNKFRVKFDSELKEAQNTALVKENEFNLERLEQQQQMQKMWVVIAILSSIITISAIWLLFSQVNSRNRFKKMALQDHLTKAPNRRAVLTHASHLFKQAKKSETQMLVCLIDLDYFKKINDTLGHDVGDNVLIAFADVCKNSIRGQDNFGRYGGEEWLVVLENFDVECLEGLFERIRNNLNATSISGVPEGHLITFSMGCAQIEKDNDSDVNVLIKRADDKLYEAKESGRNRFLLAHL